MPGGAGRHAGDGGPGDRLRIIVAGAAAHRNRSSAPPAVAPQPAAPPAAVASQPAAQPPPGTEAFGVNVNRLFNDRTYTPAEIDAQLAALAATGATIARSDAFWEYGEPAAPVDGVHRYDWAFDDQIAGSLAAHDLAWLPIIDYSALWDESIPGQDHSPPRSDGDYAAYAQAFAARYGAGGSFWREHPDLPDDPVTVIEIWNEPDNGEFWDPSPAPAAYADLYLAARAAIDAADPSARDRRGPDLADHVPAGDRRRPPAADRPARRRGDPSRWESRRRAGQDQRCPPHAALAGGALGPAVRHRVRLDYAAPGALDQVQALRRTADILSTVAALGHLDCGVAAAILYTWVTPERDPSDSGDWFGIDPPWRRNADTAAFAAGLRAAGAPGATRGCVGGDAGAAPGVTRALRRGSAGRAPTGRSSWRRRPCAGTLSARPLSRARARRRRRPWSFS